MPAQTKTTHTPRPWVIVAITSDMVRVAPLEQTIDERGAAVICDISGFDRESAAHLIVASPDLLLACRAVSHATGSEKAEAVNLCRAAITKAQP